ncbi:carbohydrate ABC transporter permease [Paenibacillus yanchengensis]|uniref:Carbohydrate ABC transporter permease n=1 Tax=Paenibacillus yanchengensis TaxID=2035833 RepID=A0ABW4YG46_9BACL
MVRSHSISDKVIDIVIYAVLALLALLCLYPIWYTLVLSFSDKTAANAGLVTLWPRGFNLTSYQVILEDKKFFTSFWISIERVVIGGLVNFVLTVMMAYPLSKETSAFRTRNLYMWYLVFCMLFTAGLIPLYMTVTSLNLDNTIWSLILPTAVPVFNVILIMNFFRSLPKELEEAAVIDGAGPWKTLIRVFIPLATPALATVTLFSIVTHWNSFFDGLIFMSKPENYPLQTYIQQLVVRIDPDMMNGMTAEDMIRMMQTSDKTLNAAKLIIAMMPILLLYPFLQKYFVHGIVMGSVKG